MADVKWIKLNVDMFDNRKIKHIRKLPAGNEIVLIWVMLLTLAGRCNAGGMIFLTENIPYTAKMLADELDFEESTVKLALDALEHLGMISSNYNGFLAVSGWDEHQNIEIMDRIREQNRLRKARFDERKRLENKCNVTSNVTGNVTVTQSNATEEDIEEDIEEDKIYRSTAGMNPGGEYPEKPKKAEWNQAYKEIVDYLNTVCGTGYRASSKATQRLISARLHDGFKIEDFKAVIRTKHAEWANDDKMRKFLRPETLFGTKFESYLNQCSESHGTSILDGVF